MRFKGALERCRDVALITVAASGIVVAAHERGIEVGRRTAERHDRTYDVIVEQPLRGTFNPYTTAKK